MHKQYLNRGTLLLYKKENMNLTLEVLFVETDLANELLLGAAEGS